jgi:hypothetical protein
VTGHAHLPGAVRLLISRRTCGEATGGVGSRAVWHYEGRWIPPTVVNPGGAPMPGLPVYRLPLPEAARTALGATKDA